MKLFPLITAGLVVVVLFVFVFQRETLFELAGRDPVTENSVNAAAQANLAATPDEAQRDEATDGPRRVSVVAIESTAQGVENAVILRGRTEALRQVKVLAETSGRVISTPLRKGAQVTAGQILCELDPGTRQVSLAEAEARLAEARAGAPESQARIAEAQARLQEAELNENAARQLSEGGFASTTRLANAEASLSSAKAALQSATAGLDSLAARIQAAEAGVERAQAAIADLTIHAPFDGVLETDTAEFGAYLNAQGGGSECATILQLDPIKLVGFVPEIDIAKVEPGARAGARLASGREVVGEVTFLSRSADLTTRTFRVEINVPNPDLMIRDGQTATIAIAADGARAHLVPSSALTLDDQGHLGLRHAVTGPDGDVTAFARVSLLRDTIDGSWVTGLPDQARVIVVGQDFVTEGTLLTVTLRENGA